MALALLVVAIDRQQPRFAPPLGFHERYRISLDQVSGKYGNGLQ